MAQLNNKFTAFWMDTTTAPWVPLTGLSATINIRNTSWTLLVNNEPMIELGWGHYIYTFAWYNSGVDYVYDCNPWATAYIESGVTNNIEQLISEIRVWGGGGGFINYEAINSNIRNSTKTITEELTKNHTQTLEKFNETNSHIELAKTSLSDKIESIDIPEVILEEKEAKKIAKSLETLDKKVSSYIDSEMSEKEEIGAIASEFARLEMEEEMNKKKREAEDKEREEEEKKMEEENDRKLLEEIKAEFDTQEQQEKEEKKKELEKELEETLKEADEIKKELKTL